LVFEYQHADVRKTRLAGSVPASGYCQSNNRTEAEEEVWMEKKSFTKLKSKWVVGLSVLVSLGLCGVIATRPNVTFGI
jgi:hypothetical protein